EVPPSPPGAMPLASPLLEGLPPDGELSAMTFFASPPFAPVFLAMSSPPAPPAPPVAAPETGLDVAEPPVPPEADGSPPVVLTSPPLPPLALALPFPLFLPETA